jgi:hypothetical protein
MATRKPITNVSGVLSELPSGDGAAVDFLALNLAGTHEPTQGHFSWNADEETANLGLNGEILQLGQEVLYHVRNNTSATISKGTLVMATGTIGNSGRITIAPMNGTSIDNAKFFLGLTTEDIPVGDDGKVTHFGKVRGINTNAYNEGDVLWVSNTNPATLVNTQPTGLKLPVAFVISKASNGILFVRATQGNKLREAHDVNITNPQEGQVLKYVGGVWVNDYLDCLLLE